MVVFLGWFHCSQWLGDRWKLLKFQCGPFKIAPIPPKHHFFSTRLHFKPTFVFLSFPTSKCVGFLLMEFSKIQVFLEGKVPSFFISINGEGDWLKGKNMHATLSFLQCLALKNSKMNMPHSQLSSCERVGQIWYLESKNRPYFKKIGTFMPTSIWTKITSRLG